MPTHSYNQGSGFKVTGGTGGVTGGSGTPPAGTTTVDEIQSDTGSNETGIAATQTGFANAPLTAGAQSDMAIQWKVSGNRCSLIVSDDSSATGEIGTSDITATTRPVASRPPTLNNFEDASGYETEQYSRTGTKYYVVELYQGGVEPETFRGPIYYNNVEILATNSTPGLTWSPGQTYGPHTDGYTYKVGSYQQVYNDDTYYAVTRGIPTEEHYAFTMTNTPTKLKMDYEISTLTNASGQTVPLRTMVPKTPTTLSSGTNSSGWITTNLTAGIIIDINQIIPAAADFTATHLCDGIVKLYAGDGTNEGLLKQFRLRVLTTATSTY